MKGAWLRSIVAATVMGSILAAGWTPLDARPLDIPSERLERPRPEQDRRHLTQAEAIALAKKAAKQELGNAFFDYEVKSVLYDPSAELWSVTFEPVPPRRPSGGCLLVLVHDADRSTESRRCA